MAYVWNPLTERWKELDRDCREATPAQRRRTARRRELIQALLAELEAAPADGVAVLYAGLLARYLVESDDLLLRELGPVVTARTQARQES
jgi:hypothetical protein